MCRPVDLEEIPAGVPEDTAGVAAVRLAEIDLLFASKAELEELWTALLADRDELLRTLSTLCNLEIDAVSAEGTFIVSSSSSSPYVYPDPPVSSDIPCPTDAYVGLVVDVSTDPDVPEGTVIELGAIGGDTCHRSAELVSGPLVMTIVAYPVTHTVSFAASHPVKGGATGSTGLSATYAAVLTYRYDGTGYEHSLSVRGITELPSETP